MIRNEIVIEWEKDGNKFTRGFRNGMVSMWKAMAKVGAKTDTELLEYLALSGDRTGVIAICYGAAYEYAERNNLPTNHLSMSLIADELEDMGLDKAQLLFDKLMEAYTPKNLKPPQEPGAKEQAQTIGNLSPVSS
jgi:hypothetical protein